MPLHSSVQIWPPLRLQDACGQLSQGVVRLFTQYETFSYRLFKKRFIFASLQGLKCYHSPGSCTRPVGIRLGKELCCSFLWRHVWAPKDVLW
jgi:hypothetical protein